MRRGCLCGRGRRRVGEGAEEGMGRMGVRVGGKGYSKRGGLWVREATPSVAVFSMRSPAQSI